MKKALKVIVKMACMCGAVALLLFEAYDTCIRPKINMIKSETWNKAWDSGYKYGYHNGRFADCMIHLETSILHMRNMRN